MPLFILTIGLAIIIGFSAHRASLCSVSAVEEIISTRRAYMLASFAKASVWVAGIALIFTEVFSLKPAQIDGWEFSTYTIWGGLLFGVGAALNGGCAVSTLTRLGNGNLGKLLTLFGFFSGAILIDLMKSKGWASSPNSSQTILGQSHAWKIWLTGGVALWMCWETTRLVRFRLKTPIFKRIFASRYKLSSAAFIIGVCNGVLFFIYGIWVHTRLLAETAQYLVLDTPKPDTLLWILFASLLLGITISALQSRRFEFRWRPEKRWFLYSGGGLLMGIGGSMIPGGNDVIWLNALPSLSLHGVPAILSILTGIAAALLTLRLMGQDIQLMDCQEDICKVTHTS